MGDGYTSESVVKYAIFRFMAYDGATSVVSSSLDLMLWNAYKRRCASLAGRSSGLPHLTRPTP